MIHLDYRDSRPIYEQVKDGFRRLIVQGVLIKEEKLPSVREMATSLAINPNTIQRAYRDLEQEGYLYTVAGKGSFVAGVPEQDSVRRKEMLQQLESVLEELVFLQMSEEEVMEYVKSFFKRCEGAEE